VAAWVSDIFSNFYLVKSHKISDRSATTEAREKNSTDLESVEFWKFFDICLTKFKNYQIALLKIIHRFLMTTGRKSPNFRDHRKICLNTGIEKA
jgi:hypothetical protein